jgi:hypothetical protein
MFIYLFIFCYKLRNTISTQIHNFVIFHNTKLIIVNFKIILKYKIPNSIGPIYNIDIQYTDESLYDQSLMSYLFLDNRLSI